MGVNERRKRGQPTISQRLTIDTSDDVSLIHLLLFKERLTQPSRQASLQQGIEKADTEYGTTSLVTENVTQRRGILYDTLTIIKTAVGTRSKDARNTGFTTAESNCSAQQITMSLNVH